MLSGNARVSVLNPDGTVFLDDVSKGDLWYFPAGYPHSIRVRVAKTLMAFLNKGFARRATGRSNNVVGWCYNGWFMLDLMAAVLAALRVFFRSRLDTAPEVLALRQQVAVLKRKRPRPSLKLPPPHFLDHFAQSVAALGFGYTYRSCGDARRRTIAIMQDAGAGIAPASAPPI
jgi:hypothetical protein